MSMSRHRNIQDNKFKVLLSIREERKQQSMKKKPTLLQRLAGMVYNKDSAPRTIRDISLQSNIHITEEDILNDLHEGRE